MIAECDDWAPPSAVWWLGAFCLGGPELSAEVFVCGRFGCLEGDDGGAERCGLKHLGCCIRGGFVVSEVVSCACVEGGDGEFSAVVPVEDTLLSIFDVVAVGVTCAIDIVAT